MSIIEPLDDVLFALRAFLKLWCFLIFGADVIFCTLWWLGCCRIQLSTLTKSVTLRHLLQTASIAITATPPPFCALVNIFCVLALWRTWWWYLPYLTYCVFDSVPLRGGRRSQFFRTLPIWKLSAEYFSATLTKQDSTTQFPPDTPYIFCYHPHGIFSAGAVLAFGSEALNTSKMFPGLHISPCTLTSLLRVPFFREWLLLQGFVSVSRTSMDYILKQGSGSGVMVVVGGAGEASHTRHNTHDLILLKRKGIFRQALQHGCRIVPVYCFGENNIYTMHNTSKFLTRISNLIKLLMGFCVPAFTGRGLLQRTFGCFPERHPLRIVVGRPLQSKKIENPTTDDINKIQQEYCAILKTLFDEMKFKVLRDGENHQLRLVS